MAAPEPPTDRNSRRRQKRPVNLVQGGDSIPDIFIGRIRSRKTMMKSREDRDQVHRLIRPHRFRGGRYGSMG